MKETMIQYFEWYLPNQPYLYDLLIKDAAHLEKLGFTRVWMPPAYKGQGGNLDVGYGVYDLYDLGEFDQKGSIPTKYGTKDKYLQAIETCQKHHLDVIADIVLNHRMGADEKEEVFATEMNWNDRNEPIDKEKKVEVWTKYNFTNRNNKYSDFKWTWKDFTGTDYDALNNRTVLMTFDNKKWDQRVSKEDGNLDFIMGNDVDFNSQEVLLELYNWGAWYKNFTHVDGFRLDAVKSIDSHFFEGWLKAIDPEAYAVGEYWSGNVNDLTQYLSDSNYCMKLFDVALHFNLFHASNDYDSYDMRTIFDNTLVTLNNEYACAFVDNHDTQPGQALQSWIQPWFKLHAYSLILLRNFLSPCVFYGDLYGIPHDKIEPVDHLEELIWLRSHILGDEIIDKFDDPHCISWLVTGEHPIVVVMTNGVASEKEFIIEGYENKNFIDITTLNKLTLDEKGHANFNCFDGKCSIFIEEEVYRSLKEDLSK